MVQLIITVTVRPGSMATYIEAFQAAAPEVRRERGCIEWLLFRDSDDPRFDNTVRPDTVVICEKWDSIESLQEHTWHSSALDVFRAAVKGVKVSSSYLLLSPALSA